jgi:hypothetical protein
MENQSPKPSNASASKATKANLIELSEAQCYRSVRIGKRQETFFNPANVNLPGIAIFFDPSLQVVHVRQRTDSEDNTVMVPTTNVAYMIMAK